MGRTPPRLLGLSDVAELAGGISRQAVADFLERGKIPRPDFRGPKDGPLWREKTIAPWLESYQPRKQETAADEPVG